MKGRNEIERQAEADFRRANIAAWIIVLLFVLAAIAAPRFVVF